MLHQLVGLRPINHYLLTAPNSGTCATLLLTTPTSRPLITVCCCLPNLLILTLLLLISPLQTPWKPNRGSRPFLLHWKYSLNLCHTSSFAAKQTAIFRGLPSSAVESCKRALQIFDDTCSSIHSGDITVEDLRKILNSTDSFETIVHHTQNSPLSVLQHTQNSLRRALQQCKDQLQSFETQQRQLNSLCSMLPDEVQGKLCRSFLSGYIE